MNFFEIMLIDFILMVFPLTLYLFYIAYTKNVNKKEKNLFFSLAIITSLYLVIKFGTVDLKTCSLLVINIPLVIAYYKKDNLMIFSLSLLIIMYSSFTLGLDLVITLIQYIIYYILYYIISRKNKDIHYYLKIFIIFKFIFTFILVSKINNNVSLESLIRVFILCIITFIVTEFVLFLMEKGDEIICYHMSIKKLEQEKQIKNSLFKITHEIKNPLAVCKGYFDMMDIDDKNQVRKYIPIIKSEVDRSLLILQDFLCMNKTKFNKEPMDINLLVENVVDSFKHIFKQKNIKCDLNLVDDDIYINGDYNRLMQVFMNIIKNSIEAINGDNGEIKIDTFMEKNKFKVVIEDNGCGISLDVMDKISEPFFTTKQNGTGLGVSLSKEILSAHNATIKYSSNEGKGTTVTILIPIDIEY